MICFNIFFIIILVIVVSQETILKKMLDLLEIRFDKENSEGQLKEKFWELSPDEWQEKIGDLEQKYLLARLKSASICNCYELGDAIKTKNEQIFFWFGDLSCLCVDAVVIPASGELTLKDNQQNDDLYFYNGTKLRQKCLTVMNGAALANDEVLITRSYNIPTDYIMHVNYVDFIKSIINVLDCSRVNMVKTVAIHIPSEDIKIIKAVYEAIEGYLSKFGIMFHKVILVIDNKNYLDNLQDIIGEQNA